MGTKIKKANGQQNLNVEAGDLKIVTRFAWWPRRVDGMTVWLQRYQYLYEWIIRMRPLPYVQGMRKVYWAELGEWELIAEKVLFRDTGVPHYAPPKPPMPPSLERIKQINTPQNKQS